MHVIKETVNFNYFAPKYASVDFIFKYSHLCCDERSVVFLVFLDYIVLMLKKREEGCAAAESSWVRRQWGLTWAEQGPLRLRGRGLDRENEMLHI